jgi:hypothetical protein
VLYWGHPDQILEGGLLRMTDQLDNEGYAEDYDEIVEEEYDGSSFRRWGIVAGIGVVVVCVGLLLVLWFGKQVFMAPIAQWLASATPTPTNTLPPTATFTQLPTVTETMPPTDIPPAAPTSQPAPEVMSQVVMPPALQEDFVDNARAWTGLGANSEFLIQEGSLILRSNQTGQSAVAYCAGDCGPFKDSYYYEAAVVDERASDYGYGIIFSINDAKNGYYAYKIRPTTGDYGLFKLVSGSWTPLVDWTKTAGLLPSSQSNTLGASLQDKNITLFLNGAQLKSVIDETPFNEGRIGFTVDQDGVRLITNNVLVYNLLETTPVPPGQALTPVAPPGQPTFTPGFPTPLGKFTPTPTRSGSCPRDTPEDSWILVITNINQDKKEMTINGVKYKIEDTFSSFYLDLDTDYTIEIGNKSYEYNLLQCKIVT